MQGFQKQFPGSIPEPGQEALEHSQRLIDRIATVINDKGPLTFAEYMQMVLYEPGMGYYSGGSRKFGSAGDFVTAPEVSTIFSQCLAKQLGLILPSIDLPDIVEVGPGSGVMARDILDSLKKQQCLPEHYYFLEISADLRERQQQLLRDRMPDLSGRLVWLEQLSDISPINGVILANEVLDALPVRRITTVKGQWQELVVDYRQDGFCWDTQPLDEVLQTEVDKRLPPANSFTDPYTTEINVHMQAWIQTFADMLDRGILLLIDYGYGRGDYYHPQRSTGTLLCHYRHHAHSDPFLFPGLQDITASVDFTTVAESAVAAGLQVAGYTTQGHFLVNIGLEEFIHNSDMTNTRNQVEASAQIRRLVMPGEMGERFKVIALTKDFDFHLAGFSNFDLRRYL